MFILLNVMIKEHLTKFLIIGFFSTLLNYSIFYIFLEIFKFFYIISSCLGFLAGVFFGFYFNKIWTYNNSNKSIIYIYKYLTLYLFSLIVSITFLFIFVHYGKINALFSNVFCIFITTLINFTGTKYWVFRIANE